MHSGRNPGSGPELTRSRKTFVQVDLDAKFLQILEALTIVHEFRLLHSKLLYSPQVAFYGKIFLGNEKIYIRAIRPKCMRIKFLPKYCRY